MILYIILLLLFYDYLYYIILFSFIEEDRENISRQNKILLLFPAQINTNICV